MANTIILKRSSTQGKVPTTAQLEFGELAINTYDGKVFIKKDDGTPAIVEVGAVQSVNGASGVVTLDTGNISEGSNQYFTTVRARGAVSAGTGISYNSSTGVISAAQNIATSASPTFAGLTLTGSVNITGNIIPSADITYDLGSPTKQWKDIYVGPGSLYVNGSKVLQDDSGTIEFTADQDQNIRIKTLGAGILQLGSSTTNVNVDGTLQIAAGKNITDSAGIKVNFGDNIEMNGNKVIGLGAPSSANDAATKTYVDTAVAAISTSSIAQGNSNVTVADTGTGTVTVSVDGSTALTVNSSGVTVAGNFTVQGTTTTVESNTISLADNIITLNSDATGSPTQNAGIEVERGDEANVQIRWNEGSDAWTFTNDGATYTQIATSTDTLSEGLTNLYHTTARARGALSASTSTGVAYNSSTGVISLGSIPNSSLANNSITINGTAVALGGTRTLDTDAVSEGSTNVYFTNTRARNAVSAGTGISYNSSTGVITNTITQYTDALARGALSFTAGSGAYNSSTGVITIPTNTNQLTNGAGFITSASVPTNTNQLTNGAGFVTSSGVTSVATGNGLTGGTITGTGTLSMSGSYTGTFTVTGDIRATGEITAYYSDERLKTNIQSIDNALSKVMAINGYTYDSSELAESLGLPKHMDQIGLMAQEVEAVMPELVTQSAIEGYKTIRYDKVVSVLVNAVKEQQAQIEELQALVKKTLH